MTKGVPNIIKLREYQPREFVDSEIPQEVARKLYKNFGDKVVIETPSFKTENHWKLSSKGWAGYIPLTDSYHFSLFPKVPVKNLFRMLEYAYNLNFSILPGVTKSKSIDDLYQRLAKVMAERILYRIRKGLYRSYISEYDHLSFARGKIDLAAHIKNPYRIAMPCQFEEHTADLEDNRILLWTLTKILKSGICNERSLPVIRKAYRALLGFSSLEPYSAEACVHRHYNRLNQDYATLHALCRFFLEHTGPTYHSGDRSMLPILINMESLFEKFVAEWLRIHLPSRYSLEDQEHVVFQMGQNISINIDIIIKDAANGSTLFILDTKYKESNNLETGDIEQVVAYAEAKDCSRAALIYPGKIESPISGMWGNDIQVKSLSFPLDGDIETAGQALVKKLQNWRKGAL